MKIGIHEAKGSFSERWIEYLRSKGISYRIVDGYKSDIINQISDCDAFMWNFNHKGAKESKFVKQLLFHFQLPERRYSPTSRPHGISMTKLPRSTFWKQ